MALPKIDYATYQLTLPSSGKTIKYRPFNVKEEKILMMALEAGEQSDMINGVLQIIENCTLGNIKKVEDLPYFDVEYIFIQLRKKSVGEIIQATKKCTECDGEIPLEINLDEISINVSDKPNNVIQITDTIGIEMRYPSINSLNIESTSKVEQTFETIAAMVASIYDGDTVHKASDIKKGELIEWIEDLPESSFKDIDEFMSDMPKIVYNTTVVCQKCEAINDVHMEGLSSFFG